MPNTSSKQKKGNGNQCFKEACTNVQYNNHAEEIMGGSHSSLVNDPTFFFEKSLTKQGVKAYKAKTKKSSICRSLSTSIQEFIHPSVNKLSVRIFGSQKAVLKEKHRCCTIAPWIIHPFSMFRLIWDFFMLILLITNLVALPLAIAFFPEDTSPLWLAFNTANDVLFIMDLFFNMRTGISPNNSTVQVIIEPKLVLKKYMKTWLVTDVLSSIPFDLITKLLQGGQGRYYISASRTLKMLRLAKLLTLLKMLRVTRLLRYASQWEEIFNLASIAIRVLNVIFTMLLIGHWNGCLMFFFPKLFGFPQNCWVSKDGIEKKPWFEQYSWSLFRAMSHMLGIGYGYGAPSSQMDLWLVMMSMLSGATCYALFIGQATNIIQQLNSSRRQYTEKMKQIEQYMAHRKLRPDLQMRVHQYYEYKYKGKMFNEIEILSELNDCLREQVLNHNCRDLVKVVPFFKGADPLFVSAVVAKLMFEVYQPGDFVITEGDIGSKMYFIQQGTVDVVTNTGHAVAQLTDGAYFGEICLLAKVKRTASIRAETYCNLYSLDFHDFTEVLKEFPGMRRTMEEVAKERLEKLGKTTNIIRKKESKVYSQEQQADIVGLVRRLSEIVEQRQFVANRDSANLQTFFNRMNDSCEESPGDSYVSTPPESSKV